MSNNNILSTITVVASAIYYIAVVGMAVNALRNQEENLPDQVIEASKNAPVKITIPS